MASTRQESGFSSKDSTLISTFIHIEKNNGQQTSTQKLPFTVTIWNHRHCFGSSTFKVWSIANKKLVHERSLWCELSFRGAGGLLTGWLVVRPTLIKPTSFQCGLIWQDIFIKIVAEFCRIFDTVFSSRLRLTLTSIALLLLVEGTRQFFP